MAKVDIAGLLTGIGSAPIDPMAGASPFEMQRQLQQEFGGTMRKAAGNLFGIETRTPQEQAQAALAQLDPTKPEDREKIIELVSRINPERVSALKVAFSQQDLAAEERKTDLEFKRERQKLERERLEMEKTRQRKFLAGDIERIAEAEEAATKASGDASKAINLLNRYVRVQPTGGIFGKAWSATKEFLGGQTEVDSLKTEFTNLVNTGIINNLPPGVASDRDIAIIQKGFPDSSWNAKEIERFLKAMAKMSAFAAEQNKEKANYLTKNRGNLAGFTQYWQDLTKSEGYAESIRDQYGLPGFEIPKKPTTWEESLAGDLGTEGAPTQLDRRQFR